MDTLVGEDGDFTVDSGGFWKPMKDTKEGCRVLLFRTFIRTLAAVELFEGSVWFPLFGPYPAPPARCPCACRCALLFLCCCWSPRSFKLKPWDTDPETMGAFLTSLLFSFQPWTFT